MALTGGRGGLRSSYSGTRGHVVEVGRTPNGPAPLHVSMSLLLRDDTANWPRKDKACLLACLASIPLPGPTPRRLAHAARGFLLPRLGSALGEEVGEQRHTEGWRGRPSGQGMDVPARTGRICGADARPTRARPARNASNCSRNWGTKPERSSSSLPREVSPEFPRGDLGKNSNIGSPLEAGGRSPTGLFELALQNISKLDLLEPT